MSRTYRTMTGEQTYSTQVTKQIEKFYENLSRTKIETIKWIGLIN